MPFESATVTYTIEVSLRRIACTNARGATCPVIQSNTRPRTTVVGMVGPVENVRTAPFLRMLLWRSDSPGSIVMV